MANQRQKPDSPSDITRTGMESPLDGRAAKDDPDTWCGLAWRIVRIATESNANMIRVGILLILVCTLLQFLAHAQH